jgi:hypothetical protein
MFSWGISTVFEKEALAGYLWPIDTHHKTPKKNGPLQVLGSETVSATR